MSKDILKITDKILNGYNISFKEAKQIYLSKNILLFDLLWAANKVREKFKRNKIELCSIVNAKSGNCSQDCKFCAQSGHNRAEIERYPLLREDEIMNAARSAVENKATCFGIVTSGKEINNAKEISIISAAVRKIKKNIPYLKCSVSLGILDKSFLLELKKAGLDRLHHNLETSEEYFPKMCTTHTYQDRLKTISRAKEMGFQLCSGGIFGLGETKIDRLKLAFTLKAIDVSSVPLNFLHPIKGTALEGAPLMPPGEILRTIAIFRLILPKKDIKVCGGRVVNLRSLQSMIFFAGASGMMIGNYLTQPGREPAADLAMIRDLGLNVI